MNKQRKKQIKSNLLFLKQIADDLNCLLDQENYYYDSIPENLQSSTRAEDSSDAIDILTESIENIEDAIALLNGI